MTVLDPRFMYTVCIYIYICESWCKCTTMSILCISIPSSIFIGIPPCSLSEAAQSSCDAPPGASLGLWSLRCWGRGFIKWGYLSPLESLESLEHPHFWSVSNSVFFFTSKYRFVVVDLLKPPWFSKRFSVAVNAWIWSRTPWWFGELGHLIPYFCGNEGITRDWPR